MFSRRSNCARAYTGCTMHPPAEHKFCFPNRLGIWWWYMDLYLLFKYSENTYDIVYVWASCLRKYLVSLLRRIKTEYYDVRASVYLWIWITCARISVDKSRCTVVNIWHDCGHRTCLAAGNGLRPKNKLKLSTTKLRVEKSHYHRSPPSRVRL